MLKLKERLDGLRKTIDAFKEPVDSPKYPSPPVRPGIGASEEPPERITFSYGDSQFAAQIFGTRSCSFCYRAQHLLKSQGVSYSFIDLGEAGSGAMRQELRSETDQFTVPYVYLRGKFVGGFTELDRIHRMGELEKMTQPVS